MTGIVSSYNVPVYTQNNESRIALVAPATEQDMQTTWECDWRNIWKESDFECEAIIKLSYKKKVLGLLRFALYPYTGDDTQNPEFLEIRNLECVGRGTRPVNPVGFWLIWYAIDIALKVCEHEPDEGLIILTSVDVEESISYYRDAVAMDEIGWKSICAGEDGYAFRFTREGAAEFCRRQENDYGSPERLP